MEFMFWKYTIICILTWFAFIRALSGGLQLSNTNPIVQLMAKKRPTARAPCSILLHQCNNRNHHSNNRNKLNNNPNSKTLPLLTHIFKQFHTNTTAMEVIILMQARATTTITTRVRLIRTLLRTYPAVVALEATAPSNITYSIYSKVKVSIRSHSNSNHNHHSNRTMPNSNNNRMSLHMVILCTIDIR